MTYTLKNEYKAAYSHARKNLRGVKVGVVFGRDFFEIQTQPSVRVVSDCSDYIAAIVSVVIAQKHKNTPPTFTQRANAFLADKRGEKFNDCSDWDESDDDYITD